MLSILKWTISIWSLYWGKGFYQYLLLASVLYLLLAHRTAGSATDGSLRMPGQKKGIVSDTLPYMLLILFIFFFPPTAWFISKCIGQDVYWRVLWLLPAIPVIALAATSLIQAQSRKFMKVLLLLISLVLIGLSGTGLIRSGSYQKFANYQKVPNEVAYCCELIREKAAEDNLEVCRVAADNYLNSYIRVYDASIYMPYGRGEKGALKVSERKLYRYLTAEDPDYKKIGKYAKKCDCNFLIVPGREDGSDSLVCKYGYTEIGRAGSYVIYENPELVYTVPENPTFYS